jgi:hypothetical protein
MAEWVAEQADRAEWTGGGSAPDDDVPPPGDEDEIPF